MLGLDIKGFLNDISGALHRVIQESYEPIFSAVQATLYHQASYTIILLVVIFWLLKLLKTGYPTREEMFEAGKWIGLVCIIYAIFYSYGAYIEFIRLLNLPASWLRNATGQLMAGDNVVDLIGEAFKKIGELNGRLWETLMKHYKDMYSKTFDIAFNAIPSAVGILPFFIFYILFFFLMVALVLIVQVSGYIALIVLSVAPVMIPLLFNRVLRPYFFSWLKLYISYSLYAPLALIILGIAISTIHNTLNMPQAQLEQMATGFWSVLHHFFPSMGLCILCIYLLLQIPNWVSQVMGVQGLQSGGVGGGLAFATGAGIATATGGAGALAGGALRYAQTGSVKESLKGAMTGGLSNAAKTMPGAETAKVAGSNGGRLARAVYDRYKRSSARGARTRDATASVD